MVATIQPHPLHRPFVVVSPAGTLDQGRFDRLLRSMIKDSHYRLSRKEGWGCPAPLDVCVGLQTDICSLRILGVTHLKNQVGVHRQQHWASLGSSKQGCMPLTPKDALLPIGGQVRLSKEISFQTSLRRSGRRDGSSAAGVLISCFSILRTASL